MQNFHDVMFLKINVPVAPKNYRLYGNFRILLLHFKFFSWTGMPMKFLPIDNRPHYFTERSRPAHLAISWNERKYIPQTFTFWGLAC